MRLTYELGYKGSGEYDTDNTQNMPINNIFKAINKLGRLEDIEEVVGYDLVTILKCLLADELYFRSKKTGQIEFKSPTAISVKCKVIIFAFDNTIVEFKEYGKTFALTREELEHNSNIENV